MPAEPGEPGFRATGGTGGTGLSGASGVIGGTQVVAGTAASTAGNPAVNTLTPTSTATCPVGTSSWEAVPAILQGAAREGRRCDLALSPNTTGATPLSWTATGIVTTNGGGTLDGRRHIAICST